MHQVQFMICSSPLKKEDFLDRRKPQLEVQQTHVRLCPCPLLTLGYVLVNNANCNIGRQVRFEYWQQALCFLCHSVARLDLRLHSALQQPQ
jgi:hypothetical protein